MNFSHSFNRLNTVLSLLLAATVTACGDSDTASTTPASDRNNSGTPPAAIACAPVGQGDAHPQHAAFDEILKRYAGDEFPGISAAIYTADGLWVGAAGMANRQTGESMTPCHAVFSGSVAKLYTVTAAMRLVEDGVIGLDDPIASYLSDDLAGNLPNAATATIRQLMNHSAGMPDQDNDDALDQYVESNNGALPSAQAQLAYLYDDPPRFAPGSSAAYSSAHTVTLSLVIDSASGAHHSDIISRDIVNKLNLSNTWYKNEAGYPQPERLAAGYVFEGELADFTVPAVNYARTSQGDAGIIATAHDYYLFLRALMEGNIVRADTLASMREPFMVFQDSEYGLGFGLGLFVIKRRGEVVKVGHSGATLGGMTHLYYYPETGSYIALTTNVITETGAELQKWGAGLLVGLPETSIMTELEAIVRGQ